MEKIKEESELSDDQRDLEDFDAALKEVEDGRSFNCSYCDKKFKRKDQWWSHERTHTGGIKPFSCSTCGKEFYEASNLRNHEIMHSNDKPHSCSLCDKRFSFK